MSGEMGKELEAKALADLIDIAVRLKESGILDLLRELADMADEIVSAVADDAGLYRTLGLADAAQSGLAKVEDDEFIQAKMALEDLVRCSMKGLAEAGKGDIPRVGLTGMLGALKDKDVQKGLGLLLTIAKGVGSCVDEKK